jgi:hypothetical protein
MMGGPRYRVLISSNPIFFTSLVTFELDEFL